MIGAHAALCTELWNCVGDTGRSGCVSATQILSMISVSPSQVANTEHMPSMERLALLIASSATFNASRTVEETRRRSLAGNSCETHRGLSPAR
jgi:hypothetical protein